MLMNILKKYIYLILIIVSCSKDDDTKTEDEIIDISSQKLASIVEPNGKGLAYRRNSEYFKYDNQNRVSKAVTFSGKVYDISYVNDNLIEVHLTKSNMSSAIYRRKIFSYFK